MGVNNRLGYARMGLVHSVRLVRSVHFVHETGPTQKEIGDTKTFAVANDLMSHLGEGPKTPQ